MDPAVAKETVELLWWGWVLIISASAAFGGFVAAVLKALTLFAGNIPSFVESAGEAAHRLLCARMKEPKFYVAHSIVGVGGGYAAVLGGAWIGKIRFDSTTENILLMISLGVIAGTIAHKLVPGIGRRLQQELLTEQVKNVGTQVEKSEKRQVKEHLKLKEYSTAISYAETALGRNDKIDTEPAIEALKSVEPYFPTERTLHIYIGRLFVRQKQYDQAILILRTFIQNLETVPQTEKIKRDKADAYYNIACYHALKAGQKRENGNITSAERLESEASEALGISIEGNPKNKANAQEDEDFDTMREKVDQLIGT